MNWTTLGPQEPPDNPMIFNRRQPDGSFRPIVDFFVRPSVAPPLDPDPWVVAVTFDAGWCAYYDMLPVGAVIRSNEAMQGWKAAKADAIARDVDYR